MMLGEEDTTKLSREFAERFSEIFFEQELDESLFHRLFEEQ